MRNQADNCAKYLAKGRKVGIVGSLQNRSYDAQDGTKRYITEVVADEVEFLSSASGETRSNAMPPEAHPAHSFDAPASGGYTEGVQPVDSDELPF